MFAEPRATGKARLAAVTVWVGIKCRQGIGALRLTRIIQEQAVQEERFISVLYLLKRNLPESFFRLSTRAVSLVTKTHSLRQRWSICPICRRSKWQVLSVCVLVS